MSIFTDKVVKFTPRLMKDLNITKIQACGIWGNIGGETGGFTALQEINPTVAGSRGGYGWMQWTGPRRRTYEAWCRKNGLNKADDETNYKYLVKETSTDERASLVALRQCKTVDAAVTTFCNKNLRPGIPNLRGRINWGNKAWAVVKDLSTPVSTESKTAGGAVVVAGGAAAATATQHNWGWIEYTEIGLGVVLLGITVWAIVNWYNKTKDTFNA